MASNNSTVCSAIKNNDPLSLVCKLCDKTYQHKDGPLMLPCLHSFCKPCLTQYIEKEESADDKMSCPTCNDRFPSKDINQFPVNLRLSHLASTTMYEKQAEGGKMKCQKCKGENPKDATCFCCNNHKFLCDECKHTMLLFCDNEEFEFIDLFTYEKGHFKIHFNPLKCPFHEKHELILYCKDCSVLICLCCAQTKHQAHEKCCIEENAENNKIELQQLINGVPDDALSIMDRTLRQIQDKRDKVKVSAKEATNRIDKMCDDLIQAVEDRREALKRKCEEIAEGKDDVLLNQIVKIEQVRKKLDYTLFLAKDVVSSHSDDEIVSVKKVIEDRVRRVKQLHQQQSLELQEDENIRIETMQETKSLVDKIQDVGGVLVNIPDIRKCSANVQFAAVKKQAKIIINSRNDAGNPVQGRCHFQYRLSKVGEDPDEYIPPKVTITRSFFNESTATLGFIPDQPGEYELTIMVGNKPIADNPYKIYVAENDYDRFQKTTSSQKMSVGGECYGVAVDDKVTIYACIYSAKTIKVFRPTNYKEAAASFSTSTSPSDLALLDDTLYVLCKDNVSVEMYSTVSFEKIGSISMSFFSSLTGICTDTRNKKVFVAGCNRGYHQVKVFSSNGDLIKSLSLDSKPFAVAVDPIGNVHVTSSSSKVTVYSLEGKKVNSYSISGGGTVSLPSSCGIHIDRSGYLLLTSYDTSTVYVVDPSGAVVFQKNNTRARGLAVHDGRVILAEGSNVSIYNLNP